jgi:hypothetical protein
MSREVRGRLIRLCCCPCICRPHHTTTDRQHARLPGLGVSVWSPPQLAGTGGSQPPPLPPTHTHPAFSKRRRQGTSLHHCHAPVSRRGCGQRRRGEGWKPKRPGSLALTRAQGDRQGGRQAQSHPKKDKGRSTRRRVEFEDETLGEREDGPAGLEWRERSESRALRGGESPKVKGGRADKCRSCHATRRLTRTA